MAEDQREKRMDKTEDDLRANRVRDNSLLYQFYEFTNRTRGGGGHL